MNHSSPTQPKQYYQKPSSPPPSLSPPVPPPLSLPSTPLPLKFVQKPVSTPTLYRIRFYTRRLLRYFRHANIIQLAFTLSFIGLVVSVATLLHHIVRYTSQIFADENDISSTNPTLYHVSTARVNITPDEPVYMAGFSTRKSTPHHVELADSSIPLYARALAIQYIDKSHANRTTTSTTLLFISLDVIAIPRSLSRRLHAHALVTYGIPSSHLILCATHTHSGPAIGDSLAPLSPNDPDNSDAILRYEARLEAAIKQVMSNTLTPNIFEHQRHHHAYHYHHHDRHHHVDHPELYPHINSRKVYASFTQTQASLAVNRRQVKERLFHADKNDHRGVTSDVVPVLMFRDIETHTLVAAMFGYTAHPTVLTHGNAYSGDYPAVAAHALEQYYDRSTSSRRSQSTSGDPLWLFVPGPAGDQNIYPRGTRQLLVRHAYTLAKAIATAVDSASDLSTIPHCIMTLNEDSLSINVEQAPISLFGWWKSPSSSSSSSQTDKTDQHPQSRFVHGGLSAHGSEIDLPFATRYSARQLRKRAREGGTVDRRAVRLLIPQLDESGLTPTSYAFPVSVWRVGDLVMVFLGGEPTVGYTQLLTPLGVDWVVGYADDVMGYIGTEDVIREGRDGGREGSERAAWYYGLPATWSVRAPQLIVHTVQQLVSASTTDTHTHSSNDHGHHQQQQHN